MRRQRWIGLVGILLMCALAACVGGRPAEPSASSIESQAPVTSVEVIQVLGDEGALRALVKGNLPDGCTRLGEPAVSSGGKLIVVILPAYRSMGSANCPGGGPSVGGVPFERTINLGSRLPAGRYTVSVNGVLKAFDLAGVEPAAQASQPDPAATPTLVETAIAGVSQTTGTEVTTNAPAKPQTGVSTAVNPNPAETASTPAQSAAATAPQIANTGDDGSQPCINKAAFFADVSVPDGSVFDPGQKFTKTWRVRNAGTCTWQGYTLLYQDGSLMGAANPQAISGSVAPNKTVDISVTMLAPDAPGSYYSDWLLSTADGALFGLGSAGNGLLWTKVGVRTLVPSVDPLAACTSQTDSSVESSLLELINAARQKDGLPALKLDSQLSEAAREHAKDMACNDFVEHYGSDGSTWFTRIQRAGVKYKSANENIYAGNPAFGGDADGAFTWWMGSKIHHDNILNPLSTRIGIGYVFYNGSTYKGYYTLNFVQ